MSSGSVYASVLVMLLAMSAGEGRAGIQTPWCAINAKTAYHEPSAKVPDQYVHLVKEGMQQKAKQRLEQKLYVALSKQEAALLSEEPITSEHKIYLVRASAFNLGPDYKRNLAAYIYSADAGLRIINTSLSKSGSKPINVALIIELDASFSSVEVSCFTAS